MVSGLSFLYQLEELVLVHDPQVLLALLPPPAAGGAGTMASTKVLLFFLGRPPHPFMLGSGGSLLLLLASLLSKLTVQQRHSGKLKPCVDKLTNLAESLQIIDAMILT